MAQLQFKGKTFVQNHHLLVKYHELVPVKAKSLTDKVSLHDNLIIHGDNLKGLKALLPLYAGKIKCVYIDPPYNTGNEGWAYNDNVNSPMMQDWLGKVVDREDLTRHDKWLCMMMPRLKLLKELLRDDGGIFISIDYNEEAHLRMLLDEVFGSENYRNTFSVARVKKNIQEREKVRSVNFGYDTVIFYAKTEQCLIDPPKRAHTKEARWHAFDAPGIRLTMEYALFDKKPPEGRHWMYEEKKAQEMIKNGELRKNPRTGSIQYLLGASEYTLLDTDWTDLQEYDAKWNFPSGEKNVDLVKRIIGMVDEPGALVLDSFAGSGTTAHAVLSLNAEDGGNRRFILVECEDYADSITAERVRRVIAKQVEATSPSLSRGSAVEATSPSLQKKSGEDAASTVYFDPRAPVGFVKGGNLPHWRQDGATYFVTWRATDSMPAERVEQWTKERDEWLAAHPEPHDDAAKAEYDRLFPARWERWLDEGRGECLLARPDIRTIVEDALRRFDAVEATASSLQEKKSGEDAASANPRYRLGEFVVMPNHVHVLLTPLGRHRLSEIVQAWKSFTAHAINKALGRKGTFWQKESFDHIVRNADQRERITRYIRDQAVEAASPSLQKKSGEDAASTNCPTFSFFELGKAVELESILDGKALPTYEELARYVFYTATGEEFDPAFAKATADKREARGGHPNFIGESRNYQVFLFYEPDVAKLKNLALTLDMAKGLPALKKDKRRLVFAPTKYLDQEHLDQHRIDFAQLPFEIYELTR